MTSPVPVLATGTALIGRLTELFGDNPLAESVAEMLMRALYASGRSADALACYASIRRHLADTLGVDPAPELRRVQQRILRDEPDPPLPGPPPAPVLAQLPLQAPGFTGRAAELAHLDAALAAGAGPGAAVAETSHLLRAVRVSRLTCTGRGGRAGPSPGYSRPGNSRGVTG
jgi:hypothetical protein